MNSPPRITTVSPATGFEPFLNSQDDSRDQGIMLPRDNDLFKGIAADERRDSPPVITTVSPAPGLEPFLNSQDDRRDQGNHVVKSHGTGKLTGK